MATPSKGGRFQGKGRTHYATANGFRSGLEDKIDKQFQALGLAVTFEPYWMNYVRPARVCKYLPDWELPNYIIIEAKGIFDTDDRQKHLLLKEQYPDLDVRFVFTNPKAPIYKRSKTTLAMWCDKHGFKWAGKLVPVEWIMEPTSQLRAAAIALAKTDIHLATED